MKMANDSSSSSSNDRANPNQPIPKSTSSSCGSICLSKSLVDGERDRLHYLRVGFHVGAN
jgi:hypothetical protein